MALGNYGCSRKMPLAQQRLRNRESAARATAQPCSESICEPAFNRWVTCASAIRIPKLVRHCPSQNDSRPPLTQHSVLNQQTITNFAESPQPFPMVAIASLAVKKNFFQTDSASANHSSHIFQSFRKDCGSCIFKNFARLQVALIYLHAVY
jgi:hypothetical protein